MHAPVISQKIWYSVAAVMRLRQVAACMTCAGGLAAPVLAGAMAAVGSPFAGGLGAAAIVGAFGAGGAHAAGTRMARRLGACLPCLSPSPSCTSALHHCYTPTLHHSSTSTVHPLPSWLLLHKGIFSCMCTCIVVLQGMQAARQISASRKIKRVDHGFALFSQGT